MTRFIPFVLFQTVQKDESQPRVTSLYVKDLEDIKLANFPADNEYNSDNVSSRHEL